MTDLEVVALIGFAVMTVMWFRAHAVIKELRRIIIRIGLKEVRVEVDDDTKIVRIVRS